MITYYIDDREINAQNIRKGNIKLSLTDFPDTPREIKITSTRPSTLDSKVKYLLDEFRDKFASIKKFSIQNIKLGPFLLKEISEMFSGGNIEEFELSCCGVEDEGIKYVSQFLLAQNTSLRVIKLKGNNITGKGLYHFQKTLGKTTTVLESIDLSQNKIPGQPGLFSWNETGVVAFTQALLKLGREIHYLDMHDNHICNTDMIKLHAIRVEDLKIHFAKYANSSLDTGLIDAHNALNCRNTETYDAKLELGVIGENEIAATE